MAVMGNDEKAKALAAAMAGIEKQFGKGSIMKLGNQAGTVMPSISTGCIALGIGGVPKGRIIEIYGPESSGKTTLALHIAAEAQKNGGTVAFVDAEHGVIRSYTM